MQKYIPNIIIILLSMLPMDKELLTFYFHIPYWVPHNKTEKTINIWFFVGVWKKSKCDSCEFSYISNETVNVNL